MTPSLFDAGEVSVLAAAADWTTGTLLGSVATGLSIIAVAIVGMMMLRGRLQAREGVRVVIGSFILFGASSIAGGFHSLEERDLLGGSGISVPSALPPPRDLSPSEFDPYGGASIRQNDSTFR
jgi:type IV secretory pathway VirB2 component (pilin)